MCYKKKKIYVKKSKNISGCTNFFCVLPKLSTKYKHQNALFFNFILIPLMFTEFIKFKNRTSGHYNVYYFLNEFGLILSVYM